MKLLRVIDLNSTEPVNYVCYHPIAEKRLLAGETEMIEPTCLAVDYPYESFTHELCVELGWQGGTIHQVLDEVRRLKKLEKSLTPNKDLAKYRDALDSIADIGGILTGEDAVEMKSIAKEALQNFAKS